MRDINRRYQIDHDSNEMWIADNLWEEREDGQVHHLPGPHPLHVDEGIVEQAKIMGKHIIRKAELKNVSTRLLKRAFLIKAHHRSNGSTLQTDEPPGEFQEMLTEFQGLFGEPTFPNSQNGRQADFEIKTDPNGKIPFHSPYRISPWEETELRRQIDKAIRCGWIEPSRSNIGSPVLFVPKPGSTLRMCIDYRAVNAIPSGIVILFYTSRIYSTPCTAPAVSQNWTWWLVTIKFASPQPTGKRRPSPLNLVCMSGESCRWAWRMQPASSCT